MRRPSCTLMSLGTASVGIADSAQGKSQWIAWARDGAFDELEHCAQSCEAEHCANLVITAPYKQRARHPVCRPKTQFPSLAASA